jgi:hypothetical protein
LWIVHGAVNVGQTLTYQLPDVKQNISGGDYEQKMSNRPIFITSMAQM